MFIHCISDGGSISKVGRGLKTNGQIFFANNQAGSGVARNLKKREGGLIFTFFPSVFYSAELI